MRKSSQNRAKITRRALLAAGGGTAMALVAGGTAARAADGDPLILGADNRAGGATWLSAPGAPILAISGNGDDGVLRVANAFPETGYAVLAEGGLATFLARGGVQGVHAAGRDVGVLGLSQRRIGVHGEGGGVGVKGVSVEGVGMKAQSKRGVALQVKGRSEFTSAGAATIPEGSSSATVASPVPLSEASLVLATPQSGGGVIRSAVKDIANDEFTLELVEPATQPVEVAWFVIG